MTEFTSVTEWGKGLRSRRHEGNCCGDGWKCLIVVMGTQIICQDS